MTQHKKSHPLKMSRRLMRLMHSRRRLASMRGGIELASFLKHWLAVALRRDLYRGAPDVKAPPDGAATDGV